MNISGTVSDGARSADRELRQEFLYGFVELRMIDEHIFGRSTVIMRVSRWLTLIQAAECDRALAVLEGE